VPDRSAAHPSREQLAPRHHAVLPFSKPSEHQVPVSGATRGISSPYLGLN
jgi:hypothetical protein